MRHLRFLFGAASLVFSLVAGAEAYPAKPVKLVVPSTPGGSADVLGRTIAQKLSESWPQPVVVDNRPGGADIIGADYVAKSAADGYTWLMATNNVMVSVPHLVKMPFDVFTDFTPVLQVVTVPFLLVVNPSVPARSMSELIEYAKANPNKLNYGSSGNGAQGHLVGELLKRSSGISMLHVPYKGSAPAPVRSAAPIFPTCRRLPRPFRTLAPSSATPGSGCSCRAMRPRRSSYESTPTLRTCSIHQR